jgi:hypothetical protein
MEPIKFKWQWVEGPVDIAQEHLVLSYGDPSRSDNGVWVPVARVGPPKGDAFQVEWLIGPAIPENEVMVQAASKQLDFT